QKEMLTHACSKLQIQFSQLQYDIEAIETITDLQTYGFYKTEYGFENSAFYKEKLAEVKARQKQLVKDKEATYHNLEWMIGEDKKKGKDFILDTVKLSIRSFNSECEHIIAKVKYNHLEVAEKRIYKAFEEINGLTTMQQVSLRQTYLDLKIAELHLKYEYDMKKQEEKEEQVALKNRIKEEAKVLKELESTRKKLEKEEVRLKNTMQDLKSKLESANEIEQAKLLKKLQDVEPKLETLEQTKQVILEREHNNRAGYVYIISNIGAFGEDIYKIGMTRKLDPEESVKELSGEAVPFDFDIHAMIFADDALTLEAQLHKRFASYQVNKVNSTKKFFKLLLSQIEQVVQVEFGKDVVFTQLAAAEEYRKSYSTAETMTINSIILSHVQSKDSIAYNEIME
ncbi:MAG: DUF4041 domain-containing protein, partial [Niameybacter sp.]